MLGMFGVCYVVCVFILICYDVLGNGSWKFSVINVGSGSG